MRKPAGLELSLYKAKKHEVSLKHQIQFIQELVLVSRSYAFHEEHLHGSIKPWNALLCLG
jgi:hypothetical protein